MYVCGPGVNHSSFLSDLSSSLGACPWISPYPYHNGAAAAAAAAAAMAAAQLVSHLPSSRLSVCSYLPILSLICFPSVADSMLQCDQLARLFVMIGPLELR